MICIPHDAMMDAHLSAKKKENSFCTIHVITVLFVSLIESFNFINFIKTFNCENPRNCFFNVYNISFTAVKQPLSETLCQNFI